AFRSSTHASNFSLRRRSLMLPESVASSMPYWRKQSCRIANAKLSTSTAATRAATFDARVAVTAKLPPAMSGTLERRNCQLVLTDYQLFKTVLRDITTGVIIQLVNW